MCKIENKYSLHSRGNYMQYLVITYNGKNCGKKNIDIYIYMYAQITLLYTWDQHNIVNQLYVKLKKEPTKFMKTDPHL